MRSGYIRLGLGRKISDVYILKPTICDILTFNVFEYDKKSSTILTQNIKNGAFLFGRLKNLDDIYIHQRPRQVTIYPGIHMYNTIPN
jgi:hypothetical protein